MESRTAIVNANIVQVKAMHSTSHKYLPLTMWRSALPRLRN